MFDSLDSLTILVTGGAGFMGSAFIRHVLKRPSFIGTIINLDALTYSGSLNNLQNVEEDSRYTFIHGRIEDKASLEEVFNQFSVDLIVHFAAETHVDRSIYDPESFLTTNILGTFRLLECVKERKHIHMHHVSTDEVYGALSHTGTFKETSPYAPNSPYAASKAASDHLVASYIKTYGISATISHACNNYGPYQYMEKLIPLAILKCQEKLPIPIYGSGLQIREWMYVEDHAEAILHILTNGKRGEVYNLGSGSEMTNLDLIQTLIQAYAKIAAEDEETLMKLITHVQDRPGHDFRYAMDIAKMKQELQFTPKVDLESGITRTVEWYLKHPQWVEEVKSKDFATWSAKHYQPLGATSDVI